MTNVDITSLGANVNVTLSRADLCRFVDEIVTSAINQVRSDLALHPKDVYYTIKQVAEIFSVDRTTLYRWEKIGYLTPIKAGGVVRYRKSDIDELFNKKEG